MSLIFPSRFAGTTSIMQYAANASQVLSAQTILVQTRVLGAGGGGLGYVFAHADSVGSLGVRFFVNENASAPYWYFGADSTTNGAPFRSSTANSVTYGAVQTAAATWDGTVSHTNMLVYVAQHGKLLALDSPDGASGTGAVIGPSGQKISIGNRDGSARHCNADIFLVARWNRILPLVELHQAQRLGAASVPMGLVMDWYNGRDWGPYHLTAPTKTAVGIGPTSPFHATVLRPKNYWLLPTFGRNLIGNYGNPIIVGAGMSRGGQAT